MNPKFHEEYLPMLAGLTVSIIFGFSFLFTKEGLDVLKPFQLLAFRFTFATLLLTILRIFGIIKINYKGKRIKILLFLALFQPVLYFIFEVTGVNMTSSSEAGMMIALIPVFVTILAAIFLNEKPTKKQLFFVIISVFGVIFITVMKDNLNTNGNIVGIFVLLGAVISAGVFNILSRKSSLHFKPVEITYIMLLIGAIVFNLISITRHIIEGNIHHYLIPLTNVKALISILYLGGLSSVVAFFMLNYMLSKIEASRSSVFANITTIVSIVAGVLIRKEPFYWFHIVGSIMIIMGVWGTNYYGVKKKKELSDA
ncbi:DMT family transporter [Thermohalobacter berrensis]|uniref:Permease n=1 Tax=Thermohalobacter berrensis TaxID=99594 RepID=A0A419SV22_9FIRM|nr:DMT family transporter [Thermohalobacter berrensis]RKD29078.1 permease [Thermohalobacter berrensis]